MKRGKYRLYVEGRSDGHGFFSNKSGQIFGFGKNSNGQVGIPDKRLTKTIFTPTLAFKNLSVKKISIGYQHTMILTHDNVVYGCGLNEFGQCCLGHVHRDVYTPEKSVGFKAPIDDVLCGFHHTIFKLKDNSGIYLSGWGTYGQLGLGNRDNQCKPQRIKFKESIIKVIKPGGNLTVILTFSGEIFKTGYVQSEGKATSFVKIFSANFFNDKIEMIYPGSYQLFAVSKSQKVYACGANDSNQLTKYLKSPQNDLVHLKCFKGYDIKDIKGGYMHTAILYHNGTVLCFGNSSNIGCNSNDIIKRHQVYEEVSGINTIFGAWKKYERPYIVQIECQMYGMFLIDSQERIWVAGSSKYSLGVGDMDRKNSKKNSKNLYFLNKCISNVEFEEEGSIFIIQKKLLEKIMGGSLEENFIDISIIIKKKNFF